MSDTFLSFRFSGKVARLLGRESVSSEIVALFELVKNSYDADASTVEVSFENVAKAGGTIRIKDDGTGMTFEDFRDRWMIVGTASKEKNTITKKGRRVVGEKGVGRFSTEKLARRATLVSNPTGKKEKIVVKINWEDYEKDGALFDEIKNPVQMGPKNDDKEQGLEIILEGLRDRWTESKIKQLAAEIGTLVLPKALAGPDQDFAAIITVPEYDIENRPIESSLLEKAPYRMIATTVNNQRLHCVIYEKKKRYERESHPFKRNPICGPVAFQLYFFPQDAAGDYKWTKYYEDNLRGLEVQDLLEEYAGVRIYRDGFWVKPYGGRGNDWLELDKMRVARRNRIGNNQVIGIVKISRDDNPDIKDTTTRERLIENEAFGDMKLIVEQAVKEFNYFREEQRQKEKELEESVPKDEQAINSLGHAQQVVKTSDLPESTKKHIAAALNNAEKKVKEFTTIRNEEIEDKETALESQRSLVTVGLATSYIAHEVIKPLGDNIKILDRIIANGNQKDASIEADIRRLRHNTTKLLHFMSFVRDYAAMISSSIDDNWSSTGVKISDAWSTVRSGFDEVLNELKISASFQTIPDTLTIMMNPVDMDSIITNLLTNSIKALNTITDRERHIKVHAALEDGRFVLRFSDNGPGVKPEDRNRIFEPLFSTYKSKERKTHGTGLGLTIAKEVLERYEGTIELLPEGEYKPGATFIVKIPLSKAKVAV